jgi:ATP-dependent Clp protease protease subunit
VYCIDTTISKNGTKGRRYTLPNATIHMHQPLGGAQGQATDIVIQAEEIMRLKSDLLDILAKHTGQDKKTVEKDSDRDVYMNATQAVEYGLVDQILEAPEKK